MQIRECAKLGLLYRMLIKEPLHCVLYTRIRREYKVNHSYTCTMKEIRLLRSLLLRAEKVNLKFFAG